MRGARGSGSWCGCTGRIIPADAGSTIILAPTVGGERDHPRGCGEHLKTRTADMCERGSSPRMRGALAVLDLFASRAGIIPADAGSTGEKSSDHE